ncbi:hypothetical protein CEXT_512321 [Caerostris extrusa]|uniref:Uncharacterized protein n=1 Tax=Caerostris extrusa TaxID=172846 RepID=A0AAV4TDC6_CAEEX|nr:hypothetical protein CEXT_512321 [Caerostris extrusa]
MPDTAKGSKVGGKNPGLAVILRTANAFVVLVQVAKFNEFLVFFSNRALYKFTISQNFVTNWCRVVVWYN